MSSSPEDLLDKFLQQQQRQHAPLYISAMRAEMAAKSAGGQYYSWGVEDMLEQYRKVGEATLTYPQTYLADRHRYEIRHSPGPIRVFRTYQYTYRSNSY